MEMYNLANVTEQEITIGNDKALIIQNLSGGTVLWANEANQTVLLRLHSQQSIIVDYDVYFSSESYGDANIVVARI